MEKELKMAARKVVTKKMALSAHLWYHKNHINLLEALNLIKQKYNEKIYLILVGSKGNNFKNLIRRIKTLALEEQIIYLGYVLNEDMPYLYKLSAMLIMPTLFESVSIPIWESFYLGVPVVSSNVCALPKQIGDAGLLFDPYNVEDMADKTYKIWIDKKLRQELIKKGYEKVQTLTIENYARLWEEVIKECIDNENNK